MAPSVLAIEFDPLGRKIGHQKFWKIEVKFFQLSTKDFSNEFQIF